MLWFVMLSVRVFAGFSAGFFVTTIINSVSCRVLWQENPACLYFFETIPMLPVTFSKTESKFHGIRNFSVFFILGVFGDKE